MAGYIKIYCIGGLGGFQGADVINPMLLQILEGAADRMWFEVKYFVEGLKPLCNVRKMVPEHTIDRFGDCGACRADERSHNMCVGDMKEK